jgi:hypothetical protein
VSGVPPTSPRSPGETLRPRLRILQFSPGSSDSAESEKRKPRRGRVWGARRGLSNRTQEKCGNRLTHAAQSPGKQGLIGAFTSSAKASTPGGMTRPSALAVLRLMPRYFHLPPDGTHEGRHRFALARPESAGGGQRLRRIGITLSRAPQPGRCRTQPIPPSGGDASQIDGHAYRHGRAISTTSTRH